MEKRAKRQIVAPLTIKKPEWVSTDQVMLEQVKLGVQIRYVQVESSEGKPLWDQVIIDQRPGGAISVPVNENDEIGIIEQFRPVVAQPDAEYPLPDYSKLGVFSWEFPRGFPLTSEKANSTVSRETHEEIGHPVISSQQIGATCLDTAFYVRRIPIFLTCVDVSRARELSPDLNEKIRQIKWILPSELQQMIASGDIFCGATLAAHALYLANQT